MHRGLYCYKVNINHFIVVMLNTSPIKTTRQHTQKSVGLASTRTVPAPGPAADSAAAGLEEAEQVLHAIYASLPLVLTNQPTCERLAERCASELQFAREVVQQARGAADLRAPLASLLGAFRAVQRLVQHSQVRRSLIKRLGRGRGDEAESAIAACETALDGVQGAFTRSLQKQILRTQRDAADNAAKDMATIRAAVARMR
ncbi:hypothetical protein PLICRDRAFT_657812 [Plicaturopsis crispa FD-325 SS-3]|nr:hypothetical protein PLICRDRAFT_657812 [Plicaturopsis crispa FD-325 SS-3]